jgi:transcriptional regulator with XRE-family HTH domain
MIHSDYTLTTPEETAGTLAAKVRQLRLEKHWKQTTLAERSGVSVASLRRFERTGLVSLQSLLRLVFALGRLDDFSELLQPRPAGSMAELEAREAANKPKRGST